MKTIRAEASIEILVEVENDADTDVIVKAVREKLAKFIKPKGARTMEELLREFKIIIIGKEHATHQ